MARGVEKAAKANGEAGAAKAYPLVACHECGQLYHMQDLEPGKTAKCGRCGCVLYRAKSNSIERSLTFALAALVLIILSNSFPFMTFKVEGRE